MSWCFFRTQCISCKRGRHWKVQPVHPIKAEQPRLVAADPRTKPIHLGRESICTAAIVSSITCELFYIVGPAFAAQAARPLLIFFFAFSDSLTIPFKLLLSTYHENRTTTVGYTQIKRKKCIRNKHYTNVQ